MAETQFGQRLDPGLLFADDIFPHDAEIGDSVLHVFRYVVVAECEDIKLEVPARRVEALFLKFKVKAARAEQCEGVFCKASAFLDGDFQSPVVGNHTLLR
jgi:hypothetical protein